MDTDKFERQRRHFPALRHWVYLDHASAGLYPKYAHDVMVEHLHHGANIGMPFEDFAGGWDFVARAKDDIAAMLHCSGEDIAFGHSAASLFTIIMNGLDLNPGDNIVAVSALHESASSTLQNRRQDGVSVRFAAPENGTVEPERVFSLVDKNTKAICLGHVEGESGFRHDLAMYGEYCRRNGILFGVDATYSAGAMEIDVHAMQVDFLAASGSKWLLSPLGVGFAYVSKSLRDRLALADTGWSGTPAPGHDTALEYGGLCLVGVQALAGVVRQYNTLGSTDIQEYILSLVDYFHERIGRDFQDIRISGQVSHDNRSNLVFIELPEQLKMTDRKMMEHGIRAHCLEGGTIVRLGFHYFNDRMDVDRLVNFLKRLESISHRYGAKRDQNVNKARLKSYA